MTSIQEDIAKEYYKTTASRGHEPAIHHYRTSAAGLRRRLREWMPEESSACLDLACGCGEMLYLLEQEGIHDTVGVDICADELSEARKFVNSRLECHDIISFLELQPPESYDFITAFNILEHLNKDAVRNVLTEVSRVLKPGGVLIAMVPNAISPFAGLTRYWDFTHCLAFTPNNFRQLAVLTGFDPYVDFRECGPVPYGFKSTVRFAAWQLIRLAIKCWLLVELADTKSGIYTMDMLVRLRKTK